MLDESSNLDLDQMSLKELKDLNNRITKAINNFGTRKKREALQAAEAVAQEHGFTLADLLDAASAKTRKPANAKYANPADPSMTWTGRGRKPLWATEALNNGKSLDDLLIQG